MTAVDRSCYAPSLVSTHIGVAILSIEAAYHASSDPAQRIEIAAIHNGAAILYNRLVGLPCSVL